MTELKNKGNAFVSLNLLVEDIFLTFLLVGTRISSPLLRCYLYLI